ncbi:MAG TPA: 50S ribosomal protein L24 [Prolixibacteraceae bacterium]|nr:50S ribosomal protein L24 [Prolixibacteraceae bacterium]HPT30298.1 50S ribosomal protein L24 [Prolixibacteraceae bacterium]
MQKKLHVKKGDTVIVITGDNLGSKGRILEIDRKTEKAIVEGVNMIKKHTKPNSKHPQGGIIEKEAPVHISNLMLVDPKTGKATRVGRRLNAEGKLVRYSKKSGEEIK